MGTGLLAVWDIAVSSFWISAMLPALPVNGIWPSFAGNPVRA
jgi:hypothetical protein